MQNEFVLNAKRICSQCKTNFVFNAKQICSQYKTNFVFNAKQILSSMQNKIDRKPSIAGSGTCAFSAWFSGSDFHL